MSDTSRSGPRRHPSLVPLRSGNGDTPFFIVHGAGGNVLNLIGMARAFPPSRPVYGLQATGVDAGDVPDPSIEAMAARYVEAVRSVQPGGPYLLSGYSVGGLIALEMAAQIHQAGDRVSRVVLFDTVPHPTDRPKGLTLARNVMSNCVRYGPTALVPGCRRYIVRMLGRRPIPYGQRFPDTDAETMGFVNLYDHISALEAKYELRTYDVDALVVKARTVFAQWPSHYGWKGIVSGRIDTVLAPGDHHDMTSPQNVHALAAVVLPFLEAARWIG
jgi:thioesterase domain-containing protein